MAKAVEYVEKEGNTIGYVSPWEKYPVRKNGVQLKNAEKEYQPRRVYPKIEELRMLGETRKRRKI